MSAIDTTADKAKQLAQTQYQTISKQLSQLKLTQLSIANYQNEKVSPEEEIVKKYYVSNTVKIKMNQFDNIGKVIAKAQELKMTVNNDMQYSVSELTKTNIIEQHESKIYAKLAAKATRLLGDQFQLGVPTELNSNDHGQISIQPRMYGMSKAVLNSGQNQLYQADNIDIQTPSEFELQLTMSGSFEIVKLTQSE